MGVDVVIGMFVETATLVPFCLHYLEWMARNDQPILFSGGAVHVVFLPRAAIVFWLIWTGLVVYFTTQHGRSVI